MPGCARTREDIREIPMSCITSIEYGDFRRVLQERAGQPLQAEFELTHRCNLSCVHCYLGSWRGRGGELSLDQVKSVLDKLQKAGFIWLGLTGGEVLLRPDFPEIYRCAIERGFIVIILTNATLIDERLADLFGRHRPFYLDISMHGADEKTYERVTGVRGSFHQFKRAIELLRERKIPFKLKTKAMKDNAENLEAIRAFASRLGVPHKISDVVHPCLDGDTSPLQHRIDAYEPEPPFRCAAVDFSVCIDPMGRLMACECARTPSHDLIQGSVNEGMQLLKNHAPHRECILNEA